MNIKNIHPRELKKKIELSINKLGEKHQCYICRKTFNHFYPYKEGVHKVSEFKRRLNLVGSDVINFRCPFCSSNDRERHLFMFFDKINFWEKFTNASILHFAPENKLSEKIDSLKPLKYIKADFKPKNKTIEKIDATQIPYPDNSFDIVICNHVLEHIPNYNSAIQEIYRVLRPSGNAILQTPYSKTLLNNFEDNGINNNESRLFFYGEQDHFRIFSENHLFEDFKKNGFILKIAKHSDLFNDKITSYYGVNSKEDLIHVAKPS